MCKQQLVSNPLLGLMDTLMNSSLLEDNGQSLRNMIDEREQLIEDTIELDRRKAVEDAE
jgi:hypothetical protein